MNEIKALTILEVYGKVLLNQIADFEYEDLQEAINQLKAIEHYLCMTSGLIATDRPDLVEDDSEIMYEINFFKEIK